MNNMVLLGICFIAGILMRRIGRMPDYTPQVINSFILNLSLPALTLYSIHSVTLEGTLFVPMSMAWLQFIFSLLFFAAVGHWMRWPKKLTACLMLTGGLGNTSFVGLPMIEALYGASGVPIGVIVDQTGSFVVLSTLGILTASRVSGIHLSPWNMIRRILLFPSFLAFIAALALRPVVFPEALVFTLDRLGQTLAPLALFAVGYQLRISRVLDHGVPLGIGLLFKLILIPFVICCLYMLFQAQPSLTLRVTIFEAAMPPMITGAILATEYDLVPELAALMVGVGIPISLLSLYGWWALLEKL